MTYGKYTVNKGGSKFLMLHEKGFSLMETVAALALFSIVSFAFLTGLCTLTKATVTTRDRAIAENLARNELEYVKTLSCYK